MTSYLDEYVLRGGITMAALIPLSLFTFGIIVQRFFDLRASRIVATEILAQVERVDNEQAFRSLRESLRANPAPLATIILDYIEAGERGESMDPKENSAPIEEEADHLYQSLSPISTSYVVAPLLGVLGTTISIMATFEQFAAAGRRDMSALVAAIDKSLVTTMWGLIIAVPAYFCFALLQAKVYRYERRVLPGVMKQINQHLAVYVIAPAVVRRDRTKATGEVPNVP
jgi:biopolymer transport protein ExbB